MSAPADENGTGRKPGGADGTRRRPWKLLLAAAAVLVVGLAATVAALPDDGPETSRSGSPETFRGPAVSLGDGRMRTYARLDGDRPVALGYELDRKALDGLPKAHTDGRHCADNNHDGRIERDEECVHSHDFVLRLPKEYRKRVGGPFRWALLTWDPHGHAPKAYGVPHFDFHFYLQSKAGRNAIRTGPCAGGGLIDCADEKKAHRPVPGRYRPKDYRDLGAVVSAMGNHLTDPASPELHGAPFTKTFLYGAYDGRITFYEPMVTRAWLLRVADGKEGGCVRIKQPAAFRKAGAYPTRTCLEGRKDGRISVALTGFRHHRAG